MSQQDLYQKAKAKSVAAKQASQPRTIDIDEVHNLIAGALYDFGSYLSIQQQSIMVGAYCDTTPLVQLLEQFCSKRDVDTNDPRLLFWQDIIRK